MTKATTKRKKNKPPQKTKIPEERSSSGIFFLITQNAQQLMMFAPDPKAFLSVNYLALEKCGYFTEKILQLLDFHYICLGSAGKVGHLYFIVLLSVAHFCFLQLFLV